MPGLANGGFRSATARSRYLAVYDAVRVGAPEPSVVHDVPTEFGSVRVYQHGPRDGIPVVLIHGFYLTSAMWADQVAGLASEITVYAIDMLGQPGASVQWKAMFTTDQCARVIDGVLAGLNLHDVHLVGHSYGGWLAAQTAARIPGRLRSVTLVDTANTVARLSTKFLRTVASIVVRPRSPRARRSAGWLFGDPAPGTMVDGVTQVFMAGFAEFGAPVNTPLPHFPSDGLLRSINMPVQVLLADNTVHDSKSGVEHIRLVVPTWDHRVWPETSHALFGEVSDEMNACISDFAREHR